MLSSVLTNPDSVTASFELLRPEPLADGAEPEARVVHCGISWDRYLAFDKALGDDRPGPRLYYLEGGLEIMTTSNEHERVKKWIGGFVEDYFLESGIEIMPRGQATMRLALLAARTEGFRRVVLLGHMADLAGIRRAANAMGELFGGQFVIPPHPGFGIALGALADAAVAVSHSRSSSSASRCISASSRSGCS